MKIQKSNVLILLLWVGACSIFYNHFIPKDYFGYDEADHMFAVSQGIYANYTDKNAISFITFLKTGIKQGLQKEKSASLSEFIRTSDDITFYRHYHGPLYFYGIIISHYFVGDSEFSARWTSSLFLILSVVAVYIGCLSLPLGNANLAAVIASAMLMCSPSNITTATQISAHGMYTLTSIIVLFLITKLLTTNDLRYWYCAIIAIAFSFAAIEYAPLLLVTFVACVFVQHRNLFTSYSKQNYKKLFAVSVVLFVGVIFIIWPGAWLKLSLVKNYLFFIYLVFVREGEFGTQTFWEVWRQRIINSPLEYMLIVPAMVISLVKIKHYVWYLPFLLYSILMLIITFRNTSPSPIYISSLLPPLYILAGITLSEYLKNSSTLLRAGISTVLLMSLFFHMYFYIIPYESKKQLHTPLKDLVNYFRADQFQGKMILVDRALLPTLHYYFPHKHFSSYLEEVDGIAPIIQELQGSLYDGVLYAGKNHYELEQLLGKSVIVHPENITRNPSSERRITYYKIITVRP